MSNVGKRYDGWVIVAGNVFRQKIVIRDPSKKKISNPNASKCNPEIPSLIYPPFDLTGYSARMDIRVGPSFEDTLVKSLSLGDGIQIGSPDPLDGTVEFFISNLDTKEVEFTDLAGKQVHFDFYLIPPVGDLIRVIFGSMPVIMSVTYV